MTQYNNQLPLSASTESASAAVVGAVATPLAAMTATTLAVTRPWAAKTTTNK